MPAIVYLKAQGIGAYRSHLRSDTLWGAICWNIRELFGDAALKGVLADYPNGEQAFFLSSAFPWLQTKRYGRTHFLPHPMLQPPLSEPLKDGDVAQTKACFRKRKNEDAKRKEYISWQQLACKFGDDEPIIPAVKVRIDSRAVTRNQIDRSRLGVLTESDSGQLFHMNENFICCTLPHGDELQAQGLYFLIDGDMDKVIPALRLMESTGIGGDRTVGKGHFEITWELDAHQLPDPTFSLPKVSAPNARMNVSIYNHNPVSPQQILKQYKDIAVLQTLKQYEDAAASDPRLWQYKLDARQGRTVLQGDYLQMGKLLFAEGSVFPPTDATPYPGCNWDSGTHSLLQHKIHRYGHAFLLDIRLK